MGLCSPIENMTFDPTEPVDAVFTEIEDFADIAESIDDPISTVQKCKLAYIVLQTTKRFKSGLRDWDRKSSADKTWDNFQSHFRNVQKQLRRTGDLTVDQAMDNDKLINLVSDNIVQRVQNSWENSSHQGNEKNIPPVTDTASPHAEDLLLALTQKIDTLGHALATLQQRGYPPPNQGAPWLSGQAMPTSYGNTQYPPPVQPATFQQGTQASSKPSRWKFSGRYCWSCGGCDHWGSKCQWKKTWPSE